MNTIKDYRYARGRPDCAFLTFFFLLVFLTLFFSLFAKPLQLSISSDSAILINADSGAVLFEKRCKEKLFPASITKIATALYTLKNLSAKLDVPITAENDALAWIDAEAKRKSNYSQPSWWLEQESSHIGIKKGEILTLRDLLYGMMIASGNDAANVIAQYTGGTIGNFMSELNRFISAMGCRDTSFTNPHGLFHPHHFTTAWDMALITREALKLPEFCSVVSSARFVRPKTNKQESTALLQTNRLLRPGTKHYYKKAIGVKTGYTSASQNTLVAAARHEGRTLIAVLLRCKERTDIFDDAIKLFERAFAEQPLRKVAVKKGLQTFTAPLKGAAKPLLVDTVEETTITFYPAEEPRLKGRIEWDKLSFPIKKGQHVGDLHLLDDNSSFTAVVLLYAHDDAAMSWRWWFKQKLRAIKDASFSQKAAFFAFVIFLIAGVTIVLLRRH